MSFLCDTREEELKSWYIDEQRRTESIARSFLLIYLECGQSYDPHTARIIDNADFECPVSTQVAHLEVHPWMFDPQAKFRPVKQPQRAKVRNSRWTLDEGRLDGWGLNMQDSLI